MTGVKDRDWTAYVCPDCGERADFTGRVHHGFVYDDADCPHKCHGAGYLIMRPIPLEDAMRRQP